MKSKITLSTLFFFLSISLAFSQDLYQSLSTNLAAKYNRTQIIDITKMITASNSDLSFGTITNFESNLNLKSTPGSIKTVQSQLSTLWMVVTLDMILADVLSSYIPEIRDDWPESAKGNEADMMLGAAIMYQIPISMIYLSRVLPYKTNRIANIIAAGLMTAGVLFGGEKEGYYYVCAGAEVLFMTIITWKALKWDNPEEKNYDLGLNLNPNKKTYGLNFTYNF